MRAVLPMNIVIVSLVLSGDAHHTLVRAHSAAIVDAKAEEIRRAKERESAEESDMRLGFD